MRQYYVLISIFFVLNLKQITNIHANQISMSNDYDKTDRENVFN